MEMDEVSERYIAPCFVNSLEAYDGDINLALNENLISNKYAVKLCLDYEPRVIFGRSFIRLVNGIVDFGSGVITVYREKDPFKDDYEKTEKSMDDWDQLLDFNFDDIPRLDGEELLLFDIGTSSSTSRHLTQEKAAKEALALRIFQKFALLEERAIAMTKKSMKLRETSLEHHLWSEPAAYLNCNDPAKRSLALQAVINPFRKISFLGSLPVSLQHVNWKPDYKGCYTNKEEAKGQWRTEIRTMGGNDDETESSRSKRSRQYETVEQVVLNKMGYDGEIDDMLRIKLREAESNKEIFNFMAWIRAFKWIRAFNINEPIYSELFHEFYITNEFDEVCADDELQTKKIIKFRLGGRAHDLTLLEFAHRLGLYHVEE
nr:hypothetical protein [Tanacetum cinerariifolium]